MLTAPVAGLAKEDLVAAMTGDGEDAAGGGSPAAVRAPAARKAADPRGEPALRAEALALEGEFEPLDLVVRAGEVLGLAGAAASGNTADGETLVGLRKPDGGHVAVRGRAVRPGSVPHAIDAGIGYVPEDRHRQGLVLGRSVAENATLTVTGQLGPCGTVLPARARAFAHRVITSLDIRTEGPAQPVSGLSGGNQQKVVIARALAREPSVLVAIRPTAGVDVKSKDALLGVVRDVAAAGSGAVIVSDELDDLRICDRVVAFFRGRVVAEFDSGWSDRQLVAAMEGMTVPGAGATGNGTDNTAGTAGGTEGRQS